MPDADFVVSPLSVGAEVIGFKDGHERDPAACKHLYDAWLDYGFLLFRDIDSIERHLAVSRCFGDLEIHPVPEARYKENQLFIEIGAPKAGRVKPPAYVFDGDDIRVNRIPWHRDTAYTPDICKGAMLRMVEVPDRDGETLLADTAKAWDDLPSELQQKLATLEFQATLRIEHMGTLGHPGTFWKSVRTATEDEYPGGKAARARVEGVEARYPSVIQPAMLVHPESGRKCLFLSPTYVDAFIGLYPKESNDLLWQLAEHMLQPKYVYKHKWTANDAIVWDNRRCMHAAVGNSPDDRRYGLRTTLAGPTRTGRYVDPDAKAPETVLVD